MTLSPRFWTARGRLVLRAASIMAFVTVASKMLPYAVWRSLALRSRRVEGRVRNGAPTERQVLSAVDRAAHLVPGGNNCLVRALTARIALARYGVRSEIVLGVAKPSAGTFEAHAWLERDGRILLGGPVPPFVPLPTVGDRL